MPRPGASASQDPLAALQEGAVQPIYYIYGRERFLVDRAVDSLKERVLEKRTRDFNFDLLYAKEAGPSRILQVARTLPMMAKRRLVVVRDLDELKADDLAALIPYVSAPCAETCLVLVGEKVDQRLKFFSAFKKHGTLVKLDPLYERQLPGFVRHEAQTHGIQLDSGVAELICDEIGADLGQIVDALERLAIYVGERKRIGTADVEQVVASTRQRTVFELARAVGEGSRARALVALGSLLAAREPGVRVVALLARHVRQLWTAQSMMGQASRTELASALGIAPFFVDEIQAQARRLDPTALERMHKSLYRADKALKSSRVKDDRLLERLIVELTKPRGDEPRA